MDICRTTRPEAKMLASGRDVTCHLFVDEA
jgi:hypothetical protein